MKKYLFFAFLIITIALLESILSLDFAKLSSYGQGYLAGKIIVLIACFSGLIYTGLAIKRDYFS